MPSPAAPSPSTGMRQSACAAASSTSSSPTSCGAPLALWAPCVLRAGVAAPRAGPHLCCAARHAGWCGCGLS
eukprot:2881476-Alexandrium_andersonii.AAC.1